MNSRGPRCFFAFLLLSRPVQFTLRHRRRTTPAPQIDPKLFSGMQWRQVGPFRGGRALAIEGVPGEPNTYYFGAVAGGVWKTAGWRRELDAALR